MAPPALNNEVVTKHLMALIEFVTCFHCCKFYVAPETAPCGHTLCHLCWRIVHSCPTCNKKINKNHLNLNMQLKIRTEHIRDLVQSFESLYGIKVEELTLDMPADKNDNNDVNVSKNVQQWLTSSQNHFSAPPYTESQDSVQEVVQEELSNSMIQIHEKSNSKKSHPKVVAQPTVQDDWDTIETIPDSEDAFKKNKENVIGPMDLEPYYLDEHEFSADHPRRSKREHKTKISSDTSKKMDESGDKKSSNLSDSGLDKKLDKAKQNWTNVKKMKKEFGKINKVNKNKLNVSIEMCKKAQAVEKLAAPTNSEISQRVYVIEDDTPTIDVVEKVTSNLQINKAKSRIDNTKTKDRPTSRKKMKLDKKESPANEPVLEYKSNSSKPETVTSKNTNKLSKIPFLQKCSLVTPVNNETDFKTNVPEVIVEHNNVSSNTNVNEDDIQITIKVGGVTTGIVINKKQNDVRVVKVQYDQAMQTNAEEGPSNLNIKQITSKDTEKVVESSSNTTQKQDLKQKSLSTKKNTASAETATVQYEITESVEKELSSIMECMENEPKEMSKPIKKPSSRIATPKEKDAFDDEITLDDVDIFNSGSVKNVQMLKHSKGAPSEILPSHRTQKKTQSLNKRTRDEVSENIPNKKQKVGTQVTEKNELDNSEVISYDTVINQVFANIDADIRESQVSKTQETREGLKDNTEKERSQNVVAINDQKYSENLFSTVGNIENVNVPGPETQKNIDNLLTPGMCEDMEIATPIHDDDSDKSVVEDTPQKDITKLSNRNNSVSKTLVGAKVVPETYKDKSIESQDINSIISLSDTTTKGSDKKGKNKERPVEKTDDTPLTMNRFVDRIEHKSTPVARKSLNFTQNVLSPNASQMAKNTQEKHLMSEAFAAPNTPVRRPLMSRNPIENTNKKYCIAGSCLSPSESANVRMLCAKRKWTFVDKYTPDLTHLVVKVDEENKSQRSVKYMCALASGKWIVSYRWVEKCLSSNNVVNEEPYEALDSTGDPGPKLSRSAQSKLFQGIIFYCMPPFTMLDVDTLKSMLQAAGGRVVNELKAIRVNSGSPSLMLAEPNDTQEDRFTYMAVELQIVPMNYEWVLNCLGSYSLWPLSDLLLCPASILPKDIRQWPQELFDSEDSVLN